MTEHAFSDEILMAYADGELDDATAQRLEAALPEDAALASRLSIFTGTRSALAPQHPPEEIPEPLMARVRATLDSARTEQTGKVVAFARPAAEKAAPGWQPLALAASLALAVGLGGGFWTARLLNGGQGAIQPVSLLQAEGVETALSEMASGESRALEDGALTLVASFRDAEGNLCREFEFDATGSGSIVSVVCHENERWNTRLAVASGTQDSAGYAPASSMDTLEAYLPSIGAGLPMSALDETRALQELGE